MRKLYYDKDGWVVGNDLNSKKEPSDYEIEVSEEIFAKSLTTKPHFKWRVIDANVVLERFEETPDSEIVEELVERRKTECFTFIDRSKMWYESLSSAQYAELNKWYQDWLNVTITRKIPQKPEWLN